MTALLCFVFFLSGAAALLFETLWFRQAGLALGNSIWASSLVLAAFMAGLALGNGVMARHGHRVRRPARLYAFLEIGVGAAGLGLVILLPHLMSLFTPWLRPFLDVPWVLNPLRLGIAFPLLVAPAAAMGATLPLLVAALCRRDPNFGRALGRLYGWNTLGAVAGALAGEMVILGWLGVRGTAVFAGGLNLVAAMGALAVSRRLEVERPPAGSSPAHLPRAVHGLLVAAFLFGAILLALEVVWFRLLLLFVSATNTVFAIMLAVVLAGIGLGGLAGSRWLSSRPDAYRVLPALALANGLLCTLVYVLVGWVLDVGAGQKAGEWYRAFELSIPLMLPVSFLSGVSFTLLGKAIHWKGADETRATGLLTLANTTGAMFGSLIGGFVLLVLLGIERSVLWLTVAYGIAALVLVLGDLRPAGRRESLAFVLAAGGFVLALGLFPSGRMEDRYLSRATRFFRTQDKLVVAETREGLTETLIYLRRDRFGEPYYYRLMTNGHSMSGTMEAALRYMKLFVYWPVAVHPDPRSALLISYGVGSTAKALTETKSLETIDVVEISRDILEMSSIVYPEPDENPLADPRVTVHIEDGRFFLQTTNRRFDLITGEPPPPKHAGIVNLYTREYFQLIRDRLADGGIATYWLPVHSLSAADARSIVGAFCDAFGDCSLWGGSGLDWILIGTRGAEGPVSAEHFSRQWDDPVVGSELRALGLEVPAQLGALFLADAGDLRAFTQDVPPLEDNHPKRLSDARRDEADVERVFRPMMETEAGRERFRRSAIVARLWPESVREDTLAYFGVQSLVDRYFLGEQGPIRSEFPRLHRVLADSSLRTLALWQLDSSVREQRIVDRALARGRSSAALDFKLGLRALADRDYELAEASLRRAEERSRNGRKYTYLRIYALCMGGNREEAAALLSESGILQSASPIDREFVRFLGETLQIGPGFQREEVAPDARQAAVAAD